MEGFEFFAGTHRHLGLTALLLQQAHPSALVLSAQRIPLALHHQLLSLMLCFPGILLSTHIPLSLGSPAALLIDSIRILSYEFPVNEGAGCQCVSC